MSQTLTLTCEWCGRSYVAQRRSSKFCSMECRVANHRYDPVQIRDQEITQAYYRVGNLRDLALKHPEMIVEIDAELRKLSNWISDITRGDWQKKLIAEENKRLI